MGASESKLTFKEDVFRLAREDNIPADSAWWAQFYQLPETAEDVFALWSPTDVRNLTQNTASRPPGTPPVPKKNLETLVYACVARLDALQHQRCFADPHQPIASQVLNCVRILTRLLPYIYEADHLGPWEHGFFWLPRRPAQIWNTKHNRPGLLYDGLAPGRKYNEEDDDGAEAGGKDIGPPLGEQLIDLLMKYLFFAGFTLPKRLDADGLPDLKVTYHIWNSGIGCRQSVGMTRENERHAIEVMRLLLSLFSRQLYTPSHIVAETELRSLSYLTTKPDRQVALSVICSLLNTVLKYNPASWRVPVDLTTSITETDTKAKLANLSLDLLLILVLYPDQPSEPNAYRKSLGRLHRVEDFQFIQQGLTTVLMQPISGVSSYLPSAVGGSSKQIPWAPEMLALFWELLQVNKRFRAFITETDRAHDFVILVLFYCMSAKDDRGKQGIVRMCVLILQTMSVEPAFGGRLNKPLIGHDSLPSVLRIHNFHGSYADFLVTTVHTLMTTTQGRLESIYPALLATINNIAPHVRDLQRATSSKLLELFGSLSTPDFLLEKEANHLLLEQLLGALNAILEYQVESNRRFVDVVLRTRKRFYALRDFTVEGALAELDRQSQERKDRGELVGPAAAGGVRSPVRGGSIDSLRSPASTRSPHLGNVPEHGAFAIGDDEDDEAEEGGELRSSASFTAPLSASSSVTEDAVPLQSRSMSEKARGKQPVGQGSFSRSTSRNTSTASLPALTTAQSSSGLAGAPPGQGFRATPEWNGGRVHASSTTATSPAQNAGGTTSSPKVQHFVWTSLSLGWYLSLIWGFIYAQDTAVNRGINGIWTGTRIKLFSVMAGSQGSGISLGSPKGAVDAVGNAIAMRIGSLGLGSGGGGAREMTPTTPTTREV
ncbi:hypothetical protein LTR78_000158 [Recurvomyces mirabilis]|uniref:Uncharacterized protein n=1 Tax=Recurvomyces mirabilis TaxID=574656 RepID=A0AAE0WWP9_9PEZI|nr:hypothetical protein LTR78_000158 [Recurvomyces mirabilis]KAK5161815.1 hypothetical protein LTS14_000160 [Recurvomyces mirabilis]